MQKLFISVNFEIETRIYNHTYQTFSRLALYIYIFTKVIFHKCK